MKVVIVGAGFGGLETATRLSETLARDVDATPIDKNDSVERVHGRHPSGYRQQAVLRFQPYPTPV